MNTNYKKIFDIMNAADHKESWEKKVYYIKTYQRGYRWGIHQIQSLLNDIYINYKKYYKDLSVEKSLGYEYCVQPLVLKEIESEKEGIRKYSVIDGQQRLTTFSLIFKALNALDSEQREKTDKIDIEYDRKDTEDILNGISGWCDEKIKEFKVEGLSIEKLLCLFEADSELDENQKKKAWDLNEAIQEILKDAGDKVNIDGKFMINAYIYLYLYFKIIIAQEDEQSYFAFLGNETNPAMDYSKVRLANLRDLYKHFTTIIWYEPLTSLKQIQKTEEDIFEDFNSRKIPLTKSELVKALFMNPDNYIKEGKQDYNSEAIKTKQITIGIKWDDIEKQLHNEELWHFYPHFNDWHSQTRFDAVIDWFVYCECRKKKNDVAKNAIENYFETDKLYAFKQLEKWVKEDLSTVNTSYEKAEVMKKWWEGICAAYNDFAVFFQPDRELVKMFHRISLIQWMEKRYFKDVTKGKSVKAYFHQLDACKDLFEKLNDVGNDKKIEELNQKIIGLINRFFDNPNIANVYSAYSIETICVKRTKCDTLEKKMKALVYASGDLLIEVFLMIFSLYILEKNSGATSRFSFYAYFLNEETKNRTDWILEHIFARGTSVNKAYGLARIEEQKRLIKEIIGSGWESYTRYKFGGVLENDEIEQIVARKQHLVALMELLLEKDSIDPQVFETPEGYLADYVNPIHENDYEGLLIEFLKDNSMGNMAILARPENTAVSNGDYEGKKDIILEKINEGKFVPIATLNVFMGTYCKKGYSNEFWYPCHRQKYMEQMVSGVNEYLKVEMEEK